MPLIGIGVSDPSLEIKAGSENAVGSSGEQGIRVNLSSFRQIINDAARPHLFQIDIPSIEDSSIALTMLAKTSILPSMSLEDKGFEFQGSKYKMAGHATFDDWNVTFIADEFHKLRHKFLAWQSLIYDPIRQIPFTAGSYKKNGVKVIQLSKDADIVSAYEFYGMYPSRVGEINLDQGSRDIETFTVTFTYDYYVINTDIPGNKSPTEASLSNNTYKYSVNRMEYGKDHNGPREHSSKMKDENDPTATNNQKEGKLTDFSDKNGERQHSSGLLIDRAGNADEDYNGRGNTEPAPLGFLADQLKKLSPFALGGDINTTDPFTFLDAANWMSFRYSPPLRLRLRKYLGDDVNKAIDGAVIPNINPYDWVGLEKKV
jgi:hypothetical protein